LPSVKASYKFLLLLVITIVLADCSVEKNTPSSRFYHRVTSRYNIYFNGNESFKSGVLKVTRGYNDDYAVMLRVFEYSDPTAPQRCSSDMERAIQKASKLISLKSMTAKPEVKDRAKVSPEEQEFLDRKEYNEWVDDSYLLIGKARFYKQEYNEATAIFDYCIKEANDPEIRKEASIWLARIFNETGKFAESYRTLTELDLTNDKSSQMKAMYFTTLADLFIKQKKYNEALDPLENSIKHISGKHSKYRFTYLLAQLNERAGNSDRAISLYREVTKMNPPYDVEFNARINIAGVFDVNSGNPKEIRKELERMLRDSKNKDFLDQIYFALGNLSIKEEKENEALTFFTKSASSPSSNPNQKGRTYLALADYYFKKNNFTRSAKYYDSTLFFIDQKNPDYQAVNARSKNLNSVVSQLDIIQREDSLQRVAAMNEADRNALITSIIEKVRKDESQGKPSNYNDMYNLGQYYENERRNQNNIDQEGKWYFYNQSALTFGRTEFRRRWGDRKLEDNWRNANKSRINISQGGNGNEEQAATIKDTTKAALDYKSPEFYLKNLPLTDSLLAISNSRIADAYINAGKAYGEKLSDPGRANEEFLKLLKRYPSSELVPETLYNLWKTDKDINATSAETYRQRLVRDYPATEFARILSDPDYYRKKLDEMKQAEILYKQAYNAYTTENFQAALASCEQGIKGFSQDQLAPKFMLLHAYCVARTSDEKSFRDELSSLIKSFPESSEGKKADDIVAFLDKKSPELKVAVEKEIASEIYAVDTTGSHSFYLIITNPKFNINLASFDVISYNIDNYTNRNFRTEGTLVDNRYITIRVSGFSNYTEARAYYDSFKIEKIVRNTSGAQMYTFLIGPKNMAAFSKDQNPDRYLLFFREHYSSSDGSKVK
jgi:tetratricopeptide (TPR) repeat protein